MENNCSHPCRELRDLQSGFDRFREETARRLAAGDVSMATINTKLNWLIGILSSIGVAVLTAAMKLVIG
ncbi:MAG: hypothetical protein IJU18_00180 [Oscillospiraceae bacterium]|nr:hypothetical protein [Oscillospiraceae bacterium]